MGDISPVLSENRRWVKERFEKCDDILNRQVFLDDGKREGLLVYVEVAVSNLMLEEHVIGLSDVQPLSGYEEAEAALLAGNGILFLEGDDQVYKISSKGYPGLGVSKAESEKVMRGSREGFTESEKLNVAEVAAYFGGGGHARAAGCNLTGTFHDCVNNLSLHIEKALKKWESEHDERDSGC